MPNFAVVGGSQIVNVIVAESAEIAEAVMGMEVVETDGVPWIGWTLVDGEWVASPEPEPAPVTE